ncbi:MAG: hypothetical protein ACK5XO_07525 [Phycisphaerales bacterium]
MTTTSPSTPVRAIAHLRRRGVLPLLLLLPAVCTAIALGQSLNHSSPTTLAPPAPASPTTPAIASIRDLPARLSALDPRRPADYFLLAEEVAMEADLSPAIRDLAIRLYVLAAVIDIEQHASANTPSAPPDSTANAIAASACLGIAALCPKESDKRWLVAVAQLIDQQRTTPSARPRAAAKVVAAPENVALDLASALGLARAGEGRRAEQLLNRPGVTELLRAYQNLIRTDASSISGEDRLREIIRDWPVCPECRNRRVIFRSDNPGRAPARAHACNTCNASPGPALSPDELLADLRLEDALLRGIHRVWSAQVEADQGAPLVDPEPALLAQRMRIDPSLRAFRRGEWVAP